MSYNQGEPPEGYESWKEWIYDHGDGPGFMDSLENYVNKLCREIERYAPPEEKYDNKITWSEIRDVILIISIFLVWLIAIVVFLTWLIV